MLLKRPENLSEKQAVKLSELLQYNLKSVRSHLMKEDFQHFLDLHLSGVGRQVSRCVVYASDAQQDRADEEDGQDASQQTRAVAELVSRRRQRYLRASSRASTTN